MRRAVVAAALAALALSGCAGSDEPSTGAEETPASSTANESPAASESPDESPSDDSAEEPEDTGPVIEVEIKGDEIEPMGKRVEVAAGEPITLKVDSDRAAELHVHSSPEQELEVEKGESTLSLTIKTPGVVDVEEHESGMVVLQLEVR